MEVAAQRNRSISGCGCGAIHVMFWKNDTSLFDYDRKVWDGMKKYEEQCWPIRTVAWHICCPPTFAIRIIKPIMMALKNRSSRSRTIFHDVPESIIADILSTYGIAEDMLPDDMGGNVRFDQSEWIEQRRAIEIRNITVK